MIFFRDCYAKVWDVQVNEKYVDLRISTSEKDKNEQYVNSNWFARCIGQAYEPSTHLNKGDRIKITKGKVTNELHTNNQGEKKSYLRVVVLGLEDANNSGSYTPAQSAQVAAPTNTPAPAVDNTTDDDYPF